MSGDTIKVEVDADLEDLIPTYLSNLDKNLEKITAAVGSGDFEQCRVLGHNMKGSGGGYGFHDLSRYGKQIEDAAKESNDGEIQKTLDQIKDYLTRIDISYV
ncbi:MAG: Hpt domain-containing protein [Leptospirales bacterium]|jgi:HPt (histidine-containing phosphotransfer) domain-containing protein